MSYEIIPILQGSQEWLSLRKNKISATDTAVIMGLNPWKTPLMLWEEKLGLREPTQLTDKMKEGSLMEEQARNFLNEKCSWNFKPAVIVSKIYPFMMASLDGMDEKRNKIVEIKCGLKSHEQALKGEIPEYYYAQCQKQLFIFGSDDNSYFSFRDENDNYCMTVRRDDAFIEKMIEAEKAFYSNMMDFTPPHATDKDFVERTDVDWFDACDNYSHAKHMREKYEEEENEHRKVLIRLADGQSCQGAGIRVSKGLRKGNVDYGRIEILKDVNLDDYRKPATQFYRISENG